MKHKEEIYWCLESPDGKLCYPSDNEWQVKESLFWQMLEIDSSNRELLWENTKKTIIAAKKAGWGIVRCKLIKA